jgi:flagellar motor switch protein FliN
MNTRTSIDEIDPELNVFEENEFPLSEMEKDALGEIGNICMGTSATTLSTLLGRRVNITTPHVSVSKGNEYLDGYEKPYVIIEVSYTKGLNGANTFLIKKEDALLMTKLLMGGDGQNEEELSEFYLSAISEVMNQMVGSSATALADTLQINVNISPPEIKELTDEERMTRRQSDDVSIVISFRMEIEDLLVSNIMQIVPYEFGKRLANSLYGEGTGDSKQAVPNKEVKVKPENNTRISDVAVQKNEKKNVDLKDAKFQPFDNSRGLGRPGGNNIDLIIDVPLQVTVVLGKSRKSVKDVLDMGMGSVIVLDRLAGDMVDILVNGKIFARGEVVVLNDNYGVRITELVSTSQIKQ